MTDILIVEDVEEMRAMLEGVVSKIAGLRVSGLAGNVWDARLELERRKPGLVLLDEVLPGESSVDLLTEIRLLDIPVLLITGIENPTHPVSPGAAGRVTKPSWDCLEEGSERLKVAIFTALATPLSG